MNQIPFFKTVVLAKFLNLHEDNPQESYTYLMKLIMLFSITITIVTIIWSIYDFKVPFKKSKKENENF